MAQTVTDPTVKDPDPILNQPLLGASVSDPLTDTKPTPPPPPTDPNDVGSQIDKLYKDAGITDAGSGGGFADRAYWLAHPSEVLNGRLGRDLAGTGTDQPTGTPGRGPWLNSGRDAPEASIGEPTRKANGGFWNLPDVAPPPKVAAPAVPSGTTPTTRPATYPSGTVADLYWANTEGQYTPTAQDLAQFGASPDVQMLNKIGPAIRAWWLANKDALGRRQGLTAALTPPAAVIPPPPVIQPPGAGGGSGEESTPDSGPRP